MKKCYSSFLVGLAIFLSAPIVFAVPINYSDFTKDFVDEPGNSVVGSTVNFSELEVNPIVFYNFDFVVGNDATILSFDYSLTLGYSDPDETSSQDLLAMEIDYISGGVDQILLQLISSENGSGNFSYDMSAFRGQTIYLGLGLYSQWGDNLGTYATISNIDLATDTQTAPVPEPATILLLGTGILGAFGLLRKRGSGFHTEQS